MESLDLRFSAQGVSHPRGAMSTWRWAPSEKRSTHSSTRARRASPIASRSRNCTASSPASTRCSPRPPGRSTRRGSGPQTGRAPPRPGWPRAVGSRRPGPGAGCASGGAWASSPPVSGRGWPARSPPTTSARWRHACARRRSRPWRATRRCSWTHAATLRFEGFARARRTGSRWPTPTGPRTPRRRAGPGGTSISRPASRGRGWAGSPWTPSPGPSSAGELERLELAHFDADRAEATERLGREPRPRAGPHPGPAPGRRPGGDGHSLGHRARRRPAPGAAVQRLRGLRDPPRPDLRAGPGHGPHTGLARALARGGPGRAGRVPPRGPGRDRRQRPAVHRGHPPGHRAARPPLHAPLLRPPRLRLRGRPHRPLRPRAARPPRRTGGCCAASTTGSATPGRHRSSRLAVLRAGGLGYNPHLCSAVLDRARRYLPACD